MPKNAFRLLVGTAIVSMMVPCAAYAQSADSNEGGLAEIIVTAQKREQSVQDIPIAVSALTQETLEANRIMTVNDLSSFSPGLTVRPSSGGIQTPAFTIRGQTSYGVVAGSDKQVSIYLDGVYISSPRGSIFDLPDISRLEVLRGPQGTLFGRNATAGAVSVTTRDPTGEAHVKAEFGLGNYDQRRYRMSVDLPQIGPFSAYFSFMRNERNGDIRNAAAGTAWDRSLSPSGFGVDVSPKYLGSVDSNSYFAAVKFEPVDTVKLVYKYDRNEDNGTPEGVSIIAFNPAGVPASQGGPLLGAVFSALYGSQEVYMNPAARRPDVVANGWAVPRQQTVQGHSVTGTWDAADGVTIKNIFAYRQANVFAPTPIDGVSSLTFTQAALNQYAVLAAVGQFGPAILQSPNLGLITTGIANALAPTMLNQRFLGVASQAASISKQWSDELQINYTSENLNLTGGLLWFHSKDESGGPEKMQNTMAVSWVAQNGLLPLGNEGRSFNKATSLAAYGQIEYKFTPQLEVVAGARVTRDEKSSAFRWDVRARDTGIVRGAITPRDTIVPPDYKKTKPSFLIGLNWTPQERTLVYAKYSNSFVSGGSTAGIEYQPETASSFELGFKSDFFDRKLRTNLALYHVDYKHYQGPNSTTAATSVAAILPTLISLYGATTAAELIPSLGTFVLDVGDVRAQGAELEVTAAPVRGLNVGASVGYTDVKYTRVNPSLLAAQNGEYIPFGRPKWTGSVYASYETQPLIGNTTLQLRMDGVYRSEFTFSSQPSQDGAFAGNANALATPAYWLVNGHAALRNIKLGPVDAELAVWGKNLTDKKYLANVLYLPFGTAGNFIPARSYGLDLTIDF
jgi:iron complex outermembrane receptor protein